MKTDRPFDLAAIDLDGTLLGPDGRVGDRNRRAVQRMVDLGIHVVIASGRMHSNTTVIYGDLGLRTPIVSYNGAMVKGEDGEMLLHEPLDPATALEVVEWAERESLSLQYYIDDILYIARDSPGSELYRQRTGCGMEFVDSLRRFDGRAPTKIILVAEPEVTLRWLNHWTEAGAGRLYVVRTMPEYLEFLHPNINKWTGVLAVAERFGISPDRVAAFGDSWNDRPMLEGAGIAVVMGYADPAVVAVADVVADGSPEDAFGAAVESLLDGARDYPEARRS